MQLLDKVTVVALQDGLEQSIVSGYTDSIEGNHWATLAKDIPFVPTMQVMVWPSASIYYSEILELGNASLC